MINCQLFPVGALCGQLMLMQTVYRGNVPPFDPEVVINDAIRDLVHGWLTVARGVADDLELQAAHDRINILERRLKTGKLTCIDLATELRVLREAIDSGLKLQIIYRYPNNKRDTFYNWKEQWSAVINSFPSAEEDIVAGVDLWALGHATASVFHFMRVLEHGLRALAKNVGKSFDIQNWQSIIEQIESEVRNLRKTLPAGLEKSERLQFLSEAAKEFFYFKDGWRNYVSHNRAKYDDHLARRTLEHVKAFMTVLASRLSETP